MIEKTRSRAKRGTTRVQKHFQEHLDFVASRPCICFATHGFECRGDVVAAHYRTAANSGTGTKPHDAFAIPACDAHHRLQHQRGQKAFEEQYGISMLAEAERCAAISPVPEIRAFSKTM